MTDSPSTTFSLGSPVGSSVKTCRFEPARRFRALCGTAPCSPSLLPAEELARRTTWAAHALAMDATKPEARSPRSLAGSGPQSWIRALWSVLSSPSWEHVLCCSFLRAARSRSTSAVWKLSTKNAPSTRTKHSCCKIQFMMVLFQDLTKGWDPRIHASAKMEQWHWHASTIHKPLLWRHGPQNVLNWGLLFWNGPNQRLTNPFHEDMDHKMY